MRKLWLAGFLVLGALLGAVGPLLITWQYHMEGDPETIGLHFLAINAGYVLAVVLSYRFWARVSLRRAAVSALSTSAAGLVALTFGSPPAPVVWRLAGLAVVGCGAGLLASTLPHAVEGAYRTSAAETVNKTAAFFSGGSCLAAAITGICYATGRGPWTTVFLAALPMLLAFFYLRKRILPVAIGEERKRTHSVRLIATVLFALLLFFQFGNEWAIAGWLPIFLVRRLGSNPTDAIFALGLYFLFLMVGRAVAQTLLPLLSHRRLALAGMVLAMGGYLILASAHSLSGAFTALVIIGLGFGPIYPLLVENLDDRFSYQPGLYSGIFSIAITGAMAEPWLLGFVCEHFGIQAVMIVPAAGSIAVCALALLIVLEAHLMRKVEPVGHNELLY